MVASRLLRATYDPRDDRRDEGHTLPQHITRIAPSPYRNLPPIPSILQHLLPLPLPLPLLTAASQLPTLTRLRSVHLHILDRILHIPMRPTRP
jgi:hypothetical protein